MIDGFFLPFDSAYIHTIDIEALLHDPSGCWTTQAVSYAIRLKML
jgi:hypothetical protein